MRAALCGIRTKKTETAIQVRLVFNSFSWALLIAKIKNVQPTNNPAMVQLEIK
jgi:hypothetical protein